MKNLFFRKDATAQGVAKQRLIETLAKPDKRVISDPYASLFVLGKTFLHIVGHRVGVWITKVFSPGFHEHLIARTRFIDDLIEKSAKEGVEQYVILGAGYDCRAHRLNLPSNMKVFEVDQLEVQSVKRSKLPSDIENASNITYIGMDFNRQSISEQLIEAGFDSSKSSIFTLEGVSQYIPKDSLHSTLNEITKITKGSKTIFFMSYVDVKLKDEPSGCFGKGYPNPNKRARMIMSLADKFGEPWISLYSKDELESVLSANGFKLKEIKSLGDLNDPYFGPLGRKIPEKQIMKLEFFAVASSD
jgi:methyltransferase (TIGR00027 family)